MRRPVVLAMSGLTAVVTSFGVWSSAQSPAGSTSIVAAGVVRSDSVTVVAAPSPTASATPTLVPDPEPTTAAAATSTAAAASASVTVTGDAASKRYGDVQVQLTITGGRIVTATAVSYPQNNGRDQEINAYAVPVLQEETVSAQGAQIDTVSGATHTSDGYVTSLQSALDAAHAAGAL